jgi:hypothetical protein
MFLEFHSSPQQRFALIPSSMALSTEMEALPQQFLEGLRVLVIDHDTTIHNAIVEKSIGWDYKGLLIKF